MLIILIVSWRLQIINSLSRCCKKTTKKCNGPIKGSWNRNRISVSRQLNFCCDSFDRNLHNYFWSSLGIQSIDFIYCNALQLPIPCRPSDALRNFKFADLQCRMIVTVCPDHFPEIGSSGCATGRNIKYKMQFVHLENGPQHKHQLTEKQSRYSYLISGWWLVVEWWVTSDRIAYHLTRSDGVLPNN